MALTMTFQCSSKDPVLLGEAGGRYQIEVPVSHPVHVNLLDEQ